MRLSDAMLNLQNVLLSTFTANVEIAHLGTSAGIDRQYKSWKHETSLLCQHSTIQIQIDGIKSGELPVNP